MSHRPREHFSNVARVLEFLRDPQMILMFRQVWHRACPILSIKYLLNEWTQLVPGISWSFQHFWLSSLP